MLFIELSCPEPEIERRIEKLVQKDGEVKVEPFDEEPAEDEDEVQGEILDFCLHSDGGGGEFLKMPAGGSALGLITIVSSAARAATPDCSQLSYK